MSVFEIIGIAIVLIITAFAVRIGITFDINDWLKRRDTNREAKLQNLCPHARVIKVGEKYGIESFFFYSPRHLMWQCVQCGGISPSDPHDGIRQSLNDEPMEFAKGITAEQKEFKKLQKRMGRI